MKKYEHFFERAELDCLGSVVIDGKLKKETHKFCISCGSCAQPGCSLYIQEHKRETFGTYKHLPLPANDLFPTRGGHPRFHELVSEISDLHDRKNTDYASGTKEGPLGNFERVSIIMKLYPGFDWDSPFGVACVYMLKQIDAAFTLRSQKRESVVGENIAARLKDVSVYSLIEQILVEEESKRG